MRLCACLLYNNEAVQYRTERQAAGQWQRMAKPLYSAAMMELCYTLRAGTFARKQADREAGMGFANNKGGCLPLVDARSALPIVHMARFTGVIKR